MGTTTKIQWTDHTFNTHWGCVKVSDACTHCYAQTWAERCGYTDKPRADGSPPKGSLWKADGPRRFFGEAHWREPLRWNDAAKAAGTRARVFCSSMADVFEDRPDLTGVRQSLFDLIAKTPNLDWQLLTKRPECVMRHVKEAYDGYTGASPGTDLMQDWLDGTPPANVWIGTTVEHQKAADERIPHLLHIPARVRFLSCEPLLGPVGIPSYFLGRAGVCRCPRALVKTGGIGSREPRYSEHTRCPECGTPWGTIDSGISWIIAGGESGPGARPMHPDWVRALRDQCHAAGVAFFFKQWGDWEIATGENARRNGYSGYVMPDTGEKFTWLGHDGRTANPSGHDVGPPAYAMAKVGKDKAGRLLDGREWNEFPLC